MKTNSQWVRRLGAGLLAVMLLVGLCACGDSEPTVTTTAADTTTTTLADEVTTTVADGATTTTVADETTTEAKATTTTAAKTTTAKPADGKALTLAEVMAKMPAKLKNTTIDFFLWEDLHNMPIGEAYRAFEKETGITVNFTMATKEKYMTELAARITAGNAPDAVYTITNNIDRVKNLQPFTNSGYDISTADWDQEVSKQFTFNGKVYAAAPANSVSHNFLVLLYSKLAIKRAKLPDPWTEYQKNPSWWTWDKVWELCDQFLENTGRKNGYWGANFGGENYVRCFGGGLTRYDPDKGKYVNLVNTPETVKRFEILLDAIEKNWSTSASDGTSFKQGKILFSTQYSSVFEKDHPHFNTDAVYMPIPTDSTTNAVFEFVTVGIPVGAKNKEAVPYMVRYCYSPETCPDFFANDDVKKIVTDMVKRGNYFFSNGWNYQIWTDMLAGTSSQVKSVCDKYAPQYQAEADDANKEIANLPK